MATEPLALADGPPVLPLELRLADSDEPLVCQTLLRCLSGQRWVCGGRWGDRRVVAKIFLDRRRCKRHWLRERRGAQLLEARGIPSARLLHAAQLPGSRAFVTVFEWVEGLGGDEHWNDLGDDVSRQAFIASVVELLVKLHRAGLQQGDPHMGNLRWVEGSLRVLDCGSIAARRKPLEPRRALDNLALQLVEFPSLGAPELDVLYRAYCRRSGLVSQRYLPLFMRLFRRQRRYHIRKNVAKAFRTCTAYLAHRDSRVRWVCDRGFDSPDLRRFLDDPDQYVRSAQPALVKDGNSAKVWRLSMDGRAVAVKRYNIKSATHGLRRAVTRSRAARSWENAQRLRLLAIPTPRPVSFVEQRFGTLRRAAWLVNEWVEGRPAAEYFDGETRRCPANTRAARELVAIIQRLGDEGILHGDLKATNFLIGPHGPVLIDLDAMRSRISGRDWRRGRARDLQRFRRNWPESVWNSFFAHPFGDMRP